MRKSLLILIIIIILASAFSVYKITGNFVLGPLGKCLDSDNGLNYFVKGNITYENRDVLYEDYCVREAKVKEYYCNPPGAIEATIRSKKEGCSNGCKDGACTK